MTTTPTPTTGTRLTVEPTTGPSHYVTGPTTPSVAGRVIATGVCGRLVIGWPTPSDDDLPTCTTCTTL